MAKKITRSELNANFYEKITDEINEIKKSNAISTNKLLQIKKRLSLIDNDYFSQIIDEIDDTISIKSLYIDHSLTNDEKFVGIKNALQTYLEEINLIVDQKIELVDNFENVFSLQDDELASTIEFKLNQLIEQLNGLGSMSEKNTVLLKQFDKLYPGLEKNLLIIDEKFETERDGGIPYQERLVNTKNANKAMVTEIKRNLNNYKVQWAWYIFFTILLILGIVLAIIIPIFVL